jgi:hypothetical protein
MVAMPTPEPQSDNILQVRVADDLVLDGGTWHLVTDQDQRPIAVIEPPETPMYRQVAAYLETKPVPPDRNVRRDDEVRAATAVCLRWGSYFALLADPARPPSPSIDDEQVSQIDDGEMARMPADIARDTNGYLLTGTDVVRSGLWPRGDRDPCPLETTMPGILAVGDIRSGSTKRVGFAVGDGSMAVTCAHRLLSISR